MIATPHGRVVVVELDGDAAIAAARAELHADERALADRLPPIRARDLVAGRLALRRAFGAPLATPILADDRGAPVLPRGFAGSISHKGPRAAGLVAPGGDFHVGVDLERMAGLRVDIAPRILTRGELAALPVPAAAREARVLLAFSIKEAIYKAIDPVVRRYVGFQEVELAFDAADAVAVTTTLPFAIDVTYREHAGHWLATARATARS